jgi:hypothetical protein
MLSTWKLLFSVALFFLQRNLAGRRYHFVHSLMVSSMSVCLSHRQWITYANIIPRLLIVYVSPTQLVIDGIWETRLIQHVKKILAYQILVGAQSTACFATCAIKSPPSCQNGLKLEMFWGHIVDRSTQENNQLLQKLPNENDRHAHDMCNFYSITLASCWVFSQFVSSHLRKKMWDTSTSLCISNLNS